MDRDCSIAMKRTFRTTEMGKKRYLASITGPDRNADQARGGPLRWLLAAQAGLLQTHFTMDTPTIDTSLWLCAKRGSGQSRALLRDRQRDTGSHRPYTIYCSDYPKLWLWLTLRCRQFRDVISSAEPQAAWQWLEWRGRQT